MKLVEKHIISPNHEYYAEIDKICFLSKNLYNKANYIIRQKFISTSKEVELGKREKAKWIQYNELQKMLQNDKDSDYEALPRKVSQWVLRQLDKNWKSFFKSIKQWKKYPDRFTGRPSLPKYKHKTDGRNILIYTIQAIHKPELKKNILCPSGTDIKLKIIHSNIQQARIIPMNNRRYKMEIVYEREIEKRQLNINIIAGIDIGVDNLSAVTSNHKDFVPILINGRTVKSINQYFNKRRAKLMSKLMKQDKNRKTSKKIDDLTFKRNCKIDDYLHKSSSFLINYLADFEVKTLVIGKNPNWKQESNMGKKNNQNFVSIPHSHYIEMLKYKAEMIGMKVIIHEEAHTSKCSFLDNEPIKHHEKYFGKRIKRGLFMSRDGTIINADINGSANIIRKAIPKAFANGIEGVVVRPLTITIPIFGKIKINRYAHKLVA